MDQDSYNRFCQGLPHTTHVVQWGGAHVWKVAGKVFVIGTFDGEPAFSFKVSPHSFDIMKEQPGLRPAPYLASRGLKWIQHYAQPGLGDDDLKAYLHRSYALVAAGLPKRTQRAIGFKSA